MAALRAAGEVFKSNEVAQKGSMEVVSQNVFDLNRQSKEIDSTLTIKIPLKYD